MKTTRTAVVKAEDAKPARKDVKALVQQTIDQSKERSHENMLALLGLVAVAQRTRKERMEEYVEAGRKFEPKFKAEIEKIKARMQESKPFQLRLQVQEKAKESGTRVEKLMHKGVHDTLARLGVPTRKDVDALSRKIDKLIELQRA